MSSTNTSPGALHLVKLSVGSESVDSLIEWQATRGSRGENREPRHVTRMWPKRAAELLDGGSIYWVIRGVVQCRQRIVRLDEVIRHDGVRMCALILDPEVVRTRAQPRRAFQGWRYLAAGDAPADLAFCDQSETPLPADMQAALAEFGVL